MFLVAILVAALLGAAFVLVIRAVAMPRLRQAERIDAIQAYGYSAPHSGAASLVPEGPEHQGFLAAAAAWLGDRAAPSVGLVREEQMRKELLAAGIYRMTARSFVGYRVLATLGLPLLAWLVSISLPIWLRLVAVAYFALMGWVLPLIAVRRRARDRFNRIERALPDLIDLLVVTVEAGLGFAASLQTASGRLEGPLASEVRLALQEQTMGLSMRESLERMLSRADTPGLRSFVRSVIQGETLGVPIGTILRNLAGEMRIRRRGLAEEQAQKAPTKMLFPLVFLILPALLVVLLGPAGVEIMNTLGDQ